MIDFWEIIGRVSVDDQFRNTMYETFTGKNPVAVRGNPFACLFAAGDYDSARQLVTAKMGPVSLMALGEWLVVSILHSDTRPGLDTLSQIVQRILGGYQSASPVFYQALGAGIVDTGFRDAFNAGSEQTYGFRLAGPDRNALEPLFADGGFSGQCGLFHDDTWDDTCKDMCIQNAGNPYAHALENKFK